jgi:hypothetical protein
MPDPGGRDSCHALSGWAAQTARRWNSVIGPPMNPTPDLPAVRDCRVVELRQYTLKPGQRDVLIELFDREFIEAQEALGMRVLGQFRDLDDADRFVWLRGFADMAARGDGLPAFYGGAVWARHRGVANATMIDSDDVLLLRPAWDGAALPEPARARAAPGAAACPPGGLGIAVLTLRAPADAPLQALCRGSVSRQLADAGGRVLGWYATEPAPNNFPRLPVREGGHVLLALTMFDSPAALEAFDAGAIQTQLQPWLLEPVQTLSLVPTARSALHA